MARLLAWSGRYWPWTRTLYWCWPPVFIFALLLLLALVSWPLLGTAVLPASN